MSEDGLDNMLDSIVLEAGFFLLGLSIMKGLDLILRERLEC